MRDPAPIVPIPATFSSYFHVLVIDSTVAISSLTLEELGYFNEKKQRKY
jgi:hypothetical protein